jgi:predicted O-methyltransferase YrrM
MENMRNQRNIKHGYARGWGIQFGDLKQKILDDPLYREAVSLIAGRSVVSEDNRINLYLILREYLKEIPAGDIIEFGSYKGGVAIFMAYIARELHPKMKVYSLDTFAGMPVTDKAIDAHSEGDFADVDLDELRRYTAGLGLSNLEFVKGPFEQTAESVLARSGGVALAHIDCDIYSSVAYSYDIVKSHMVEGGYIVFDDALYSSCLGATEAVEDLAIRRDGLNCEQIFPHFVFRMFKEPR